MDMFRIAQWSCLVALVLAVPAVAQDRGRIVGRVLDAASGQPLAGAQVEVDGTALSTLTGLEGRYALLRVPAGPQTVRARMIGYAVKAVSNVVVPGEGTVVQDITMTSQVFRLATVEVVDSRAEQGSVNEALESQRTADNIVNAISAEQIGRTPDGDAGQAVQRVSGVTVQDGRYVFVRGLGERYTTTSLNGARIPSPEPERRVVPLDLFPAGLLEGITTSKTFTPDQPGDFAGAHVNLRTREFPARRVITLSASTSVNAAVAGRTILLPPSLGGEWLGLAGPQRQLPQPALEAGNLQGATQDDLNAVIGSFRNVWTARTAQGGPSGSFGLSVGGEDPVLGQPIGYIGSFTYSYGAEVRQAEQRAVAVSDGEGTRPQNAYVGTTGRMSVLWGGLVNVSSRLGATSKLSFNNTYNRSAENEATNLQGVNEEFGLPLDVTRLTFIERSVQSHQLAGEHLVDLRHRVDWSGTWSRVDRNEPDRSDFVREADWDPTTGAFTPTRWFGAPRSATRTFSTLNERSGSADLSIRLAFGDLSREFAIKFGAGVRGVRRDADSRAFDVINYLLDESQRAASPDVIFDDANINAGALGLFINANGGRYDAQDVNRAGFLQFEVPVSGAIRVIGGARVEQARLDVRSLAPNGVEADAGLDDTDVLPSLAINVRIGERTNVRASGSQTLSRPEYRELAPISYFEPLGGTIVFGNPDLERALIQNADVRWETFPNPREVLSIGVFAKRFERPIERIVVGTTGAPALSFVNADGATNYGLEGEVRKSLAALASGLHGYTVFANGTWMHSKIRTGNAGVSSLTNPNRAMVGQAPYVLNAGLGYSDMSGSITATLLFNLVGRRIVEAGVLPLPDTYEEARSVLDFSIRMPGPAGASVKLDMRNLLDTPYQLRQGAVTRHRYRSGRMFALGFTWRI